MSRFHVICLLVATACGSSPIGAGADGGSGDPDAPAATPDADPVVIAACPWIADRNYADDSDVFFEPTQLIRIDLTMADSDWQYQLDNPDEEAYKPVDVTFCGETVARAAMRFKRSSWTGGPGQVAHLEPGYKKNPMILDMNEFVGGQRLRGLRKINLEYEDDLTFLGQRLNFESAAAFGLEVPRTNHADVYMNGEYLGVFINIERVDKSFATYHWGENDGHLYKHAYCGTYRWRGSSPTLYYDPNYPSLTSGQTDPRCYTPKSSDLPADMADLIHAIDVVDRSGDNFENAFPQVVAVDEWIRMAAATQAMPFADSPAANANNFYTYFPPGGGPARITLWDMDAGYWQNGMPCGGAETVAWSLTRIAGCFSSLPLFQNVLSVPAWRAQYFRAVREFIDGPFSPAQFVARLDAIDAQLDGPIHVDPNRRRGVGLAGETLSWEATIDHVKARQAARVANVDEQLTALGY
jgi:hypothetical protein